MTFHKRGKICDGNLADNGFELIVTDQMVNQKNRPRELKRITNKDTNRPTREKRPKSQK